MTDRRKTRAEAVKSQKGCGCGGKGLPKPAPKGNPKK